MVLIALVWFYRLIIIFKPYQQPFLIPYRKYMHFTKCNSATIGTYNLHSKLYNKTRPLSCSTQCHLNYHCNVTIVRLNAVENNTMSAPYKTSLKKFLFVRSNTKSATCCPGVNELNLHGIIR